MHLEVLNRLLTLLGARHQYEHFPQWLATFERFHADLEPAALSDLQRRRLRESEGEYALSQALYLALAPSMIQTTEILEQQLQLFAQAIDQNGNATRGFTWDNYTGLNDPLYIHIFWRSVAMSVGSTLLCLALGYPLAYFMAMRGGRFRNLCLALAVEKGGEEAGHDNQGENQERVDDAHDPGHRQRPRAGAQELTSAVVGVRTHACCPMDTGNGRCPGLPTGPRC